MLKNLKVKNFKCFDTFNFSFDDNDHSMLLLGRNGVGKTTLADVLEIFQKSDVEKFAQADSSSPRKNGSKKTIRQLSLS